MKSGGLKIFVIVFLVGAAGIVAWLIFQQLAVSQKKEKRSGPQGPLPVEVALIEQGPITLNRSFSGALEPLADFVVAPKVSGRIEKLLVNISDTVQQGQVVGAACTRRSRGRPSGNGRRDRKKAATATASDSAIASPQVALNPSQRGR